jgi:hypothetical protein
MNNVDIDLPQSVRIAAQLCSISESGLRKMIAARVVPCLRVGVRGGGVRVVPSEVIACLKRRQTRRST